MNQASIYKAIQSRPYQVSCGAVVIDSSDKVLFLSRDIDGRNHVLPRGTLENNETPEQCVVREIKEETGYQIEVINYIGHMTYTSSTADLEFDKVVLFFVARPTSSDVGKMDGEYDEVSWVNIKEAVEKAEHRDGSVMIKRAAKILEVDFE